MTPSTIERLDQEFSAFPIMKALETPSDDEITQAATALGVTFHDDYVSFLKRYGGAMVGSLPVFGLRPVQVMGERWSVVEVTRWFRKEGWTETNEWYVVSEDGFGNPIGIAHDEQVLLFDHDSGHKELFASGFEEFLTKCLPTP